MSDHDLHPTVFERHANGAFASMAMLAGMELDLFTALADGPLTAAELGAAIGADPDRLSLLLYALAAAELLTVVDGRFANTTESDRYLVAGKPGSLAGLAALYRELWTGSMATAETYRTGAPQAAHDFGAMDDEGLGQFFAASFPGARSAGRHLATIVDFSDCRRLLDAAGGSGGVAIGICEANPALDATVADLPSVVAHTRRFIDEAGFTARISTDAVDLVNGPPSDSYDAVVLRNLIQVLSADDAAAALANIGRAVEPGGILCLIGWILDDNRTTPFNAAVHNLVFINFYEHGQAYTEGEHRAWLEAAGFTDIRRQAMFDDRGILTARKA